MIFLYVILVSLRLESDYMNAKSFKKLLKSILFSISDMFSFMYKFDNISILYYHDVVHGAGFSYQQIEYNNFLEQMRWISKRNYETLLFDDLNNESTLKKGTNKYILITFDDGYRSNYETVFPIMRELNLKFNIFLEVGAINKRDNYMTWDMINEMKDSGIVGFGAHTYNHIDMRNTYNINIPVEILKANAEILERTGIRAEDFCFPFGYYDKCVVRVLCSLNVYKRLYTTDAVKKYVRGSTTVYGRVGIENDDSLESFRKKVEGRYNLYYRVSRIIRNAIRDIKVTDK